MIRIYVFVSGLALGAPDPGSSPKGMSFLLGSGHGKGTDDKPVPSHVTTISNADVVFRLIEPTEVRIEHRSGASRPGTIRGRTELKHFANLRKFAPGAKVREKCLGASATSQCTSARKPILGATLRVEGGWTLSAHSRCRNVVEPGLTDNSLWRFAEVRNVSDPKKWIGDPQRLADTFGLWMDVSSLEEVRVTMSGVEYTTIQLEDEAECRRLIGSNGREGGPERCAVLDVASFVERSHPRQSELPPYDAHMPALYDVLSKSPGHKLRIVPVLYKDAGTCIQVMDPPFTRCKPPIFE